MPSNLLILPLLGGFCLIHLFHYLRFRSQRLDGYRLLLESAVAGTALFGATLGLDFCLRQSWVPSFIWLVGSRARGFWREITALEYSGCAAGSLLLGIALPLVANAFFSRKRAKARAIEKHGDALMRLLHKSEAERKPIAVTLRNMKWYAGLVAETPNFRPGELHFRILPVLSGYRDKSTLEVRQTLYYRFPESMRVNARDLEITISMNDVAMAGLFDLKLWFDFFSAQDPRTRETVQQIQLPEATAQELGEEQVGS